MKNESISSNAFFIGTQLTDRIKIEEVKTNIGR